MKLAMYQMQMDGDAGVNMRKSLEALQKAAQSGADLILYPELQFSTFFPQYAGADAKRMSMEAAELAPICEACRRYHIMAAPNIYLKENGHFYDATFLINRSGQISGCQKMVHIAQAEQFYEQDYYTPSDTGFPVFTTEFGKIGIVVCFDRHYPESIRTEALQGADLILIPTANTKAEPMEMFEWEVRVQAFQNSTAIAMCNRTGLEDQMDFAGRSMAVDAEGKLIAMAEDREQIVYADIDLLQSQSIRSRKPYTTLRRPEWYL